MLKKKIILMVCVSLILLSQITAAILPILGTIWAIIIGNPIADFFGALGSVLSDISQRMIVSRIIDYLSFSPMLRATEDLPKLILLNPEIMKEEHGRFIGNPPLENMVNFMISILIPFYVFAFVLIALYLIFVSSSPIGRARAKSSLLKLIASIPIILLTIPIIQLFIDISEILTSSILNLTDITVGIEMLKASINFTRAQFLQFVWISYWPALRFPVNTIMIVMPIFIIIFIRYFIIIIYTIMFPLTVFMYAFHFSRRIGDVLLKQTIWWIFSQVMMAFILMGISVAALSLPLPDDLMLKNVFGMGGFLALAVAPLITMMLVNWGKMAGIVRDVMYTGWVSLGAATIGLGVEAAAGEEEVSPPEPVGPPRIPPPHGS